MLKDELEFTGDSVVVDMDTALRSSPLHAVAGYRFLHILAKETLPEGDSLYHLRASSCG